MSTATPYNYNWIDGVTLTSVYRDSVEGMFQARFRVARE